jgi:hypothetical protein
LLLATAVVTLNALLKLPVAPLFSATERAALAVAAPEFLLMLLSGVRVVVVVVAVLVVLE